MFAKNYSNFVKETSLQGNATGATIINRNVPLSGDEARQIYLNEIKDSSRLHKHPRDYVEKSVVKRELHTKSFHISDKDLFLSVQNDDIDTLKLALNACPDNVKKLDEYGWSLLMIACQANSIQAVKELIKRGVDTNVRDKAGNSAQSLIIKNKNYVLADILLSNKCNKEIKTNNKRPDKSDRDKRTEAESFICDLCNVQANNKTSHLSSTIHNINLSKDKKLPTNYIIPESNRGYQIMLKVGWDKESGLGPDGSGKKYPIKAVQKQDRKGLGHGKRAQKVDTVEEIVKHKNRKIIKKEYESQRKMEIDFRWQFY